MEYLKKLLEQLELERKVIQISSKKLYNNELRY